MSGWKDRTLRHVPVSDTLCCITALSDLFSINGFCLRSIASSLLERAPRLQTIVNSSHFRCHLSCTLRKRGCYINKFPQQLVHGIKSGLEVDQDAVRVAGTSVAVIKTTTLARQHTALCCCTWRAA